MHQDVFNTSSCFQSTFKRPEDWSECPCTGLLEYVRLLSIYLYSVWYYTNLFTGDSLVLLWSGMIFWPGGNLGYAGGSFPRSYHMFSIVDWSALVKRGIYTRKTARIIPRPNHKEDWDQITNLGDLSVYINQRVKVVILTLTLFCRNLNIKNKCKHLIYWEWGGGGGGIYYFGDWWLACFIENLSILSLKPELWLRVRGSLLYDYY